MKTLCIILAILFALAPFIPWTISIVKAVTFSINCEEYLSLAADANSIEIAEKHLSLAIAYLEENDMTEGHSQVFIKSPANDIGAWYENLKSAQAQLQELKARDDVTELEESNALMKLRETLLSNEGYVTVPNNISLYPSQVALVWLNVLGALFWVLAIICGIIAYEMY